jgi:hypothetical protein
MRNILLGGSMLVAIAGSGQNTINVDKLQGRLPAREFYSTGGFPLNSTKYIKIASGSPYLKDYFMTGSLATSDSVEYENLRLKLDLLEGSISYVNDKGEELICSTPASKISLFDSVSGKMYTFINGSSIPGADPKVWYQALSVGKVNLYKHIFKDIFESKPYGSSVTEQTIRTSDRYFVSVNNTFVRVKKPKEIAENVSKNSKELADFIDKEKLSGKKEYDYIEAVEHYNSLN